MNVRKIMANVADTEDKFLCPFVAGPKRFSGCTVMTLAEWNSAPINSVTRSCAYRISAYIAEG